MLKLVKVRECDGVCCKESPRFPNADHTDCIYRTQQADRGCELMIYPDRIPIDIVSPAQPEKTAKQCFEDTCLNWPHNDPNPAIGDTGGCCWQWAEVD